MSWITIDDDFYRSSVGVSGVQYGLEYDPETGDYQLKEQTFPVGFSVFYKNGTWTSDAQKDPKLFVDGQETAFAKDLAADMKSTTYDKYLTLGGSSKGNVINNSARPENQNAASGVQNGSDPGASSGPSLGNIATSVTGITGLDSFLDPLSGISDISNQFDTKGDDILKGFGTLKYPSNILENEQDTLHITQYRYQPPRADIFTDPGSILQNGLERSSTLKKPLNTIILPIPNNASDANSVSWGPDNMNNLTAAATGAVVKDLGKYSAIALGGVALSAATGVSGGGQGAVAAKLLKDLAGKASNSQNAKVAGGTALGSKILNMAGFQVEAESILARAAGIVPNSNLELLFGGPTLREFTFTYRMSPRSKSEATEIKKIIRSFKQGMAARKVEGSAGSPSYYLSTPNVFKLTYKTGTTPISGMNKFKICALTGFSVNYVPDGQWAAYEGGQPVSYLVTMGFQEIEPLYETDYRSDVDQDLIASGDQDPVGLEDIGY